MIARLLDAGYEVTVWNRTREKAEALEQLGASVADSPAVALGRIEDAVRVLRPS